MDNLDEILEKIIFKLYANIIYKEEKILKDMLGEKLSLKEFKTLDTIYEMTGRNNNTAGAIASALGITLSTCTINIDRLCAKGYLSKVKNDSDKRVIHIILTAEGNAIRKKRETIRRKMITKAISGLNNAEKVALINLSGKFDI